MRFNIKLRTFWFWKVQRVNKCIHFMIKHYQIFWFWRVQRVNKCIHLKIKLPNFLVLKGSHLLFLPIRTSQNNLISLCISYWFPWQRDLGHHNNGILFRQLRWVWRGFKKMKEVCILYVIVVYNNLENLKISSRQHSCYIFPFWSIIYEIEMEISFLR